jgi:hypothetical protein
LALGDFNLVTLNNQYRRKGDIDVQQLFSITSVKKDVLRNQDLIAEKVVSSLLVAASEKMPEVPIGEHCFSPYSCDFMGTCWKHVPKNSVFEITGISKNEQFGLFNAGVKTIPEIPEKNEFNKNINLHIQAVKKGEAVVDKRLLSSFIERIKYPLYFMDFETFMPAVPIFDNTKPYQHIPFQYSIHYKAEKAAVEIHFAFLAEQGTDPRKEFLTRLLADTEGEGSILVYDALMERNVLNALKADFPEYSQEIDQRLSRIIDLMTPFQEKAYYHPAMKNSFSIKNVLPAVAPGLNFSDLKISSGSIAMIVYEQLQTETDMFRILEMREQLHEYCKMDTYAMLRVYEKIEEAAAE